MSSGAVSRLDQCFVPAAGQHGHFFIRFNAMVCGQTAFRNVGIRIAGTSTSRGGCQHQEGDH